MQLTETDGGTFDAEVTERTIPVVVDFYADWCRPCRGMTPIVHALAVSLEGDVHFVKVNIDQSPELARRFDVRSIPTFVRFDGGQVTCVVVGARTERGLRDAMGFRPRASEPLAHRWWSTRARR